VPSKKQIKSPSFSLGVAYVHRIVITYNANRLLEHVTLKLTFPQSVLFKPVSHPRAYFGGIPIQPSPNESHWH